LNELYKWKKQLFEGAVDVFTKKQNGSVSMSERENERLKEKLKSKDQLISELVQVRIILKMYFINLIFGVDIINLPPIFKALLIFLTKYSGSNTCSITSKQIT